jgi:hypothetical protein
MSAAICGYLIAYHSPGYRFAHPGYALILFSGFNFRTANSHASVFSRRDPPELYINLRPSLEAEGAGKAGCRSHPWVPCKKSTEAGPQVQPDQSGFPCAVVYGLLRALPGDRACLPPSPLRSLLPKSLTPASGRQDHTTSPSASRALVCRALSVHRISPQRS